MQNYLQLLQTLQKEHDKNNKIRAQRLFLLARLEEKQKKLPQTSENEALFKQEKEQILAQNSFQTDAQKLLSDVKYPIICNSDICKFMSVTGSVWDCTRVPSAELDGQFDFVFENSKGKKLVVKKMLAKECLPWQEEHISKHFPPEESVLKMFNWFTVLQNYKRTEQSSPRQRTMIFSKPDQPNYEWAVPEEIARAATTILRMKPIEPKAEKTKN